LKASISYRRGLNTAKADFLGREEMTHSTYAIATFTEDISICFTKYEGNDPYLPKIINTQTPKQSKTPIYPLSDYPFPRSYKT